MSCPIGSGLRTANTSGGKISGRSARLRASVRYLVTNAKNPVDWWSTDSSEPLEEKVRTRSIAGSREVVVIKQLWKLIEPLTSAKCPRGIAAADPHDIRGSLA